VLIAPADGLEVAEELELTEEPADAAAVAPVVGEPLVTEEPPALGGALAAGAAELERPGISFATTPTINATAATAPAVVQRKTRRTRSNAIAR